MHHDLYNMTELMCSCDLIMILDATASSQYSACSTLTEQVQCPLAQRQQRNVKSKQTQSHLQSLGSRLMGEKASAWQSHHDGGTLIVKMLCNLS